MPAGDLTMHSPRRASMAGSVRDVTAHLLDDAQPDPMSQAEPIIAQQVVQAMVELPAPAAGLLARPLGKHLVCRCMHTKAFVAIVIRCCYMDSCVSPGTIQFSSLPQHEKHCLQ